MLLLRSGQYLDGFPDRWRRIARTEEFDNVTVESVLMTAADRVIEQIAEYKGIEINVLWSRHPASGHWNTLGIDLVHDSENESAEQISQSTSSKDNKRQYRLIPIIVTDRDPAKNNPAMANKMNVWRVLLAILETLLSLWLLFILSLFSVHERLI